MDFFTWKDQFSVHIPEMDKQHREFFQMMNRIYQYNSKDDRDPQNLDDLFGGLCGYVQSHFEEEERLLEMTGFEGLPLQKTQHQYFREQLVQFRQQQNEGRVLPQSVLNFMRDWFLTHILETDNQYGSYLKNI